MGSAKGHVDEQIQQQQQQQSQTLSHSHTAHSTAQYSAAQRSAAQHTTKDTPTQASVRTAVPAVGLTHPQSCFTQLLHCLAALLLTSTPPRCIIPYCLVLVPVLESLPREPLPPPLCIALSPFPFPFHFPFPLCLLSPTFMPLTLSSSHGEGVSHARRVSLE